MHFNRIFLHFAAFSLSHRGGVGRTLSFFHFSYFRLGCVVHRDEHSKYFTNFGYRFKQSEFGL